jgi:hypothetical protein
MAAHKLYILQVTEYDFEMDNGEYEPDMRERLYLFSPFAVAASTEEEAIGKLSNRVGWCVKDVKFLENCEEEVFSLNKF